MAVQPKLFESGVRPIIDAHLADRAKEVRDYGDYWSASSAGYCMRRQIMERLKIPPVKIDARKQRIFSAGDIFHEWIQGLTKEAGVSIAQERELIDNDIMVKGHFDDLIQLSDRVVLYDYKSTSSRSFGYKEISQYHRMQVGTYLYMLRKLPLGVAINEARVLKISKDDLRLAENEVLWSPALEKEIVAYWNTLNGYWKKVTLPKCTCHVLEGGFLAREAFNPYFYNGKPCSIDYFNKIMSERANA